jgi:hypothetical protein
MKLSVGLSAVILFFTLVITSCSSLETQTFPDELSTWDEIENIDAVLNVAAVTTYYVSGTGVIATMAKVPLPPSARFKKLTTRPTLVTPFGS